MWIIIFIFVVAINISSVLAFLEFPANAGSSNIWISQDDTLWMPVYKFPKQLRQWKILYCKSSLTNPKVKKKILKNQNHISNVNISKSKKYIYFFFLIQLADHNTANSLPLTNEKKYTLLFDNEYKICGTKPKRILAKR